jgi:hypothetical protein
MNVWKRLIRSHPTGLYLQFTPQIFNAPNVLQLAKLQLKSGLIADPRFLLKTIVVNGRSSIIAPVRQFGGLGAAIAPPQNSLIKTGKFPRSSDFLIRLKIFED